MNGRNLLCLLFVVFGLCLLVSGKKRYPDPKTKASTRPKPVKLNTDILPPLQDILESLGMTRFLKDLVKMGVTETRLLVRLSPMDFRMMAIEWDGVTTEEITKLKDEIAAMVILATVVEVPVRPELAERGKLSYGRVYLPDAVQSHEYILGSFGTFPPIGKHKLEIPQSVYGCESTNVTDLNYQGSILAVKRGNCSFLIKAQNAKRFHAAGVIMVNNEDRLESPASGLGIDKNITESSVLALKDFPIMTFSNTSWAKIDHTYHSNVKAGVTTYIDMVPLKCKSGGVCAPLLEEEKQIQDEVTWGSARVRSSGATGGAQVRSFDFLTSNFGGQLPTSGATSMIYAEPRNACMPLVDAADEVVEDAVLADGAETVLSSKSSKYADLAVVVERGGCRFDVKALHAQNAGARLLVIVDKDDNALQRVGGMQPDSGFVGIPTVIVTAAAGDHLQVLLGPQAETTTVSLEITPSRDNTGADAWIELAHTEWSSDPQQYLLQLEGQILKQTRLQKEGAGSGEIVAWLHRKRDKIVNKDKKSIDTDGY